MGPRHLISRLVSGIGFNDLTLILMQLWADQRIDERLVAALTALHGGKLTETRTYAMAVASARCLEACRLCWRPGMQSGRLQSLLVKHLLYELQTIGTTVLARLAERQNMQDLLSSCTGQASHDNALVAAWSCNQAKTSFCFAQLLGQPEWTGLEEDLKEIMQMCKTYCSEETAYYSALLQHYTKVTSEACCKPQQHTTFGHSLHLSSLDQGI